MYFTSLGMRQVQIFLASALILGAQGALAEESGEATPEAIKEAVEAEPGSGTQVSSDAVAEPAASEPAPAVEAPPASPAAAARPPAPWALVQGSAPVTPREPVALDDVQRPKRAPLGVTLQLDALFPHNSDKGYALFGDEDALTAVGLSGAYDLAEIGEGVVLAPELGLTLQSAGSVVPAGERSLRSQRGFGALRARYRALAWLEGFARVQGGVQRSEITIQDTGEGYVARDTAPELGLGAGATVGTADRVRRRGKADLGVALEGGYLLAPTFEVQLEPESPSPRIAVRTASLGGLSRSGPYVKLSGYVRF
jgi:hypothetical protein